MAFLSCAAGFLSPLTLNYSRLYMLGKCWPVEIRELVVLLVERLHGAPVSSVVQPFCNLYGIYDREQCASAACLWHAKLSGIAIELDRNLGERD